MVAVTGERPTDLTHAREAVERASRRDQAADPLLLELRELEAAAEGLPVELGGVHRGRIWTHDPISVTFDGWAGGERVAIRALRPSRRADPVWLRRLERGVRHLDGVLAPVQASRAGWPHLTVPLGGPSLSAFLPAEDRPSTLQVARFLAGGLRGLQALHTAGLVHGGPTVQHLVQTEHGVRLAWLDPLLNGPHSPQEDLRMLGQAVARLDPQEQDPVGALARGWVDAPPPTAEVGSEILQRTLAAALADRRHRLAIRGRAQSRRDREARLLRLVRRLQLALHAPTGRYCLRAGHDAVMVIAEISQDGRVRGGPVAGLPARFMPQVWSEDGGLDAVAARALMRAWATRRQGDDERRRAVQEELGTTDDQAALLCRWLSAQARLRAVRMIMELGG